MTMARKDFAALARAVKNLPPEFNRPYRTDSKLRRITYRDEVSKALANTLYTLSDTFNRQRFMEACESDAAEPQRDPF